MDKEKQTKKIKTIVAIILLIISVIVLIAVSIAQGFYKQIIATGFTPTALFFVLFMLSVSGIGASVIMLIGVENL